MKHEISACLRLAIVSLLLCGLLYPAFVLGLAQAAFPASANGSLLYRADGSVIGSRLLAQSFSEPGYFWPRPSAVAYNAAAAAGSNLSPAGAAFREAAQAELARYANMDGPVPAELLCASGSGLDPHITLSAARWQLPRVARARGLPERELEQLLPAAMDDHSLRIFGEQELVNVLLLNLALDELAAAPGH